MKKIHNKKELQNFAINHAADIDYIDFMKIYRKCKSQPYFVSTRLLILHYQQIIPYVLKKPLRFIIKMSLSDEIEVCDGKIKSNQAQSNLDGEAAKTSALSSKEFDKYEYLTGEDLGYKQRVVKHLNNIHQENFFIKDQKKVIKKKDF